MTRVPQNANSTAKIKAAAAASNSIPNLRQTVEDLCDQVDRLETKVNDLVKRKT